MSAEDATNDERRAAWRDLLMDGPFNRLAGMTVREWTADAVVVELPYDEQLTSYPGIVHGGVVGALLDATALGAVLAGHDFSRGGRLSTASMTVNFVGSAPGEGLVAEGRCTRRGTSLHFAQVDVRSTTGKLVAQGVVTVAQTASRT